MNERTRNEIALWLLDRVAQGKHEEIGSMDRSEFTVDGQTIQVTIMRDKDDEYPVWMDGDYVADFTLHQNVSEALLHAALDLWYDSLYS